jgi:hypothetical protein
MAWRFGINQGILERLEWRLRSLIQDTVEVHIGPFQNWGTVDDTQQRGSGQIEGIYGSLQSIITTTPLTLSPRDERGLIRIRGCALM